MNDYPPFGTRRPLHPVARIAAAILAICLLALSLVVGLTILAVVTGLAVLSWIGLAIGRWWSARRTTDDADEALIEVEYRVIRRDREP
ncbi:MAG: hypothetical protein Kow0020_10560 [Wenzhouxiangellaceae bacterium]